MMSVWGIYGHSYTLGSIFNW